MEFKIIYPIESLIYGDSFKNAIKNYIKINHNLQISKMIVTDRSRNMEAQIKYYQQDGRNKVGINMFPVGLDQPIPVITDSNTYIPPTNLMLPYNPLVNSILPLSPLSPIPAMPFIPTVINIPNV
jgi:hypothetical protein